MGKQNYFMSKTLELRFNNAEFRADTVKSDDGDQLVLSGYAAVFNSLSDDLGGFREMIIPGAFTRSLAGSPDVRLLINHDGIPLARTASKSLTLSEDAHGLSFRAVLDDKDPHVMRVVRCIQRGDMNQCSFGFRAMVDTWREDGGQTIRELRDCELHDGDVSAVTYPAYKATQVGVDRGLDAARASYQEYRNKQTAIPAAEAQPKTMSLELAKLTFLL